jgi:hypothetical protein
MREETGNTAPRLGPDVGRLLEIGDLTCNIFRRVVDIAGSNFVPTSPPASS